jgi:hypothetical protein
LWSINYNHEGDKQNHRNPKLTKTRQPYKNMKKIKQLLVALALATGLSVQTNAETTIIGDFETGDFGSFWKAGSFTVANGGNFYAYTPGAFGQIGKTMGLLQANTNYTLSLDYQDIYGWEDRPYIELISYNVTSGETLLAAGYAGPTSGVWRTGTLSLSAATISSNFPTWVGQQFNVKISGVAIAVDNVTLTATAVPEPSTYACLLGGIAALLLFRRQRVAS